MSYYHFRTAGPIWLKFLYCFSMVRNLVQVSRILGFPIGNKGVLRTTGDRGRFLRIMDIPWVPIILRLTQKSAMLPFKVKCQRAQ